MRLASAEILASVVERFAKLRPDLTAYRAEMLDHPIAGWCLRNYVVLTERPDFLAELGLSEAEWFWSRYYWLKRFTRVWTTVVGYDAGLEQQLVRLLEFAPDDLGLLARVNAAAEHDAAGPPG